MCHLSLEIFTLLKPNILESMNIKGLVRRHHYCRPLYIISIPQPETKWLYHLLFELPRKKVDGELCRCSNHRWYCHNNCNDWMREWNFVHHCTLSWNYARHRVDDMIIIHNISRARNDWDQFLSVWVWRCKLTTYKGGLNITAASKRCNTTDNLVLWLQSVLICFVWLV